MKVGIIYPNTETSRYLSIRLLENGFDVAFLCPDNIDRDLAQNMIIECNMVGHEQDSLRKKEKSFSVERYDMSDCDVLVIPWLDIKDKKDADYSDMCLNLFRMMKSVGVQFSPNARILFGHNVAGLAAAAEWGKVWPATKTNVLVTCSVYRASQKIHGPAVRALPVQRNPVKIIYEEEDCDEMKFMEGKWTSSSFLATETRLFYDVLSSIKKNQSLEHLGVVGKFCSSEECRKLEIPENSVFWHPTDELSRDWFDSMLPNLKESLTF